MVCDCINDFLCDVSSLLFITPTQILVRAEFHLQVKCWIQHTRVRTHAYAYVHTHHNRPLSSFPIHNLYATHHHNLIKKPFDNKGTLLICTLAAMRMFDQV